MQFGYIHPLFASQFLRFIQPGSACLCCAFIIYCIFKTVLLQHRNWQKYFSTGSPRNFKYFPLFLLVFFSFTFNLLKVYCLCNELLRGVSSKISFFFGGVQSSQDARMCLVEQFSDGGKRPAITNATRPAPPSTHMHVQPPPPRRNSIPFKYKLMSIRLPRFCDISKWN